MAHICVVDDQKIMRDSVAASLERARHRVDTFGEPTEALRSATGTRYDLILTDLKMPRMDGLTLLRNLRKSCCDTPVIMMTAFGTVPDAVEAMKLGAIDFAQKPFDADRLELQVERALRNQQLRQENEALRTSIDDLRQNRMMVGDSEAIISVRDKIAQYSRSDATVLISGESGTGKELVAAAVYDASPRSGKPMLCVNCAALSANLLESELFGHERGAFTGADRARRGRFELADGGTLLLDEVSEMALPLQSKLLRVLQEGEFERVGSSVTQRADVRVIATTNRDLQSWVEENRFRQDLYYRLNVLPIHLPPLRERRDDVARIVEHFLTQMARNAGSESPKVDARAMEMLRAYDWPGNVRELENLCRRAVTTRSDGVLSAEDVSPWLTGPSTDAGPFAKLRHGRMLEDLERKLIERTLTRFDGHRAKTAEAVGIGLRTLGLKLKQWKEQDGDA